MDDHQFLVAGDEGREIYFSCSGGGGAPPFLPLSRPTSFHRVSAKGGEVRPFVFFFGPAVVKRCALSSPD